MNTSSRGPTDEKARQASGSIRRTKTSTPKAPSGSVQPCTGSGKSRPHVALTYEQIAERAKAIWQAKGCARGRDEQNWYEAESQLKAELDIR